MTPRDINDELRARIRANPERDHSGWLQSRLSPLAPADRETIAFLLIQEFQRTGQFALAEGLLLDDIARHPRHPYPLIALAEHYHYYVRNLQKAKRVIARAIRKALSVREFGYHSLGVQARLAIETQDWKLLERSLRGLTTYRHKTGNADVFPERDFLSRIPPNAIRTEVIVDYVRRRSYLSAIGYSTLTGRSNPQRRNRGLRHKREKLRHC